MTLRARLLSWWRPPWFADPEEQRIAAATLPLASLFTAAALPWLPGAWWIYGRSAWALIPTVAVLGYGLAAVLVRRRRVRPGAWTLVATAFLDVSLGVWFGGLQGPMSSLYVIPVLAAGLLLDLRACAVTAALSVASLLGIGALHMLGSRPEARLASTPLADTAVTVSAVGLSVALAWIVSRALRSHRGRLAESEARFRALTDNVPDVIAEFEGDGRMIYASPAYERALGYTAEEIKRLDLRDLVHPDDLASQEGALQRVLEGEHELGRIRLRHRDGSWRWFDFAANAFTDADGQRRVVTVGRDVSETQELQEQLQRAQRLDALGRLAGGVAHDFNNFLTVILGSAELLCDELPKDSPLADRAEEIQEAGRRSAALTGQLLAFGRRQPFQPRVLDLNRLLADMDRLLRRLLPDHIVIDAVRGGGLGRVHVDPAQFEQVVLNLAINARDAMPEGGTLTIETANVFLDAEYTERHPEASPGRHVMLAVSDTGTGMEAGIASHAFEPFFTTKPSGAGTGLGLSTVHGIVSQSGGHIELYSEPGQGTSVKVYLPRVEDELDAPEAPALELDGLRGSETVLVAEDAELVRQHVRQILEANGYRVLEAADGREALAVAEAHPEIEAVVTDVMMPGLGGLDLAARLRERQPGLPVVFVSGYTENGMAARGLERGALLVSKPFTPRELLQALRRALATRRPPAT